MYSIFDNDTSLLYGWQPQDNFNYIIMTCEADQTDEFVPAFRKGSWGSKFKVKFMVQIFIDATLSATTTTTKF